MSLKCCCDISLGSCHVTNIVCWLLFSRHCLFLTEGNYSLEGITDSSGQNLSGGSKLALQQKMEILFQSYPYRIKYHLVFKKYILENKNCIDMLEKRERSASLLRGIFTSNECAQL